MKPGNLRAVMRVAATYTGTVIGAGFASGQEIMQFFAVFGGLGLLGILLTGILFCWLGVKIMNLGYFLQARSYSRIVQHVCGRKTGLALDILTTLFLFGGLAIMLSGTGTVFRDHFGYNFSYGLALMTLAIIGTTWGGLSSIAAVNTALIPLLTVSTVLISAHSLVHHGVDPAVILTAAQAPPSAAPHWLIASLLYAAYNLVLATTVLGPLGCQTAGRTARLWGGLLGGLVLALLGAFMTIVILLHSPGIFNCEVPMLFIAGLQHSWSHSLYGLTLVIAMYTTAIASLYGCATKLQAMTGWSGHVSIMLLTLAAVACSYIGFAKLIGILYPLFGYLTVWFIFKLVWQSIRDS